MHMAITTSKLSSVLLVTLCFSFITFVTGDGTKCRQVGCGCQFTNESGTYEISMEKLKTHGTHYTAPGGFFVYYINPCYGITVQKSKSVCKDVTMCQMGGDKYFAVANYDIEDFSPFINENSPVTVTYRVLKQGGISRQMIINLKYGESVPPKKVTQGGSSPSYTYTLAITSPLLRPHKVQPSSGGSSGLSTGSVIVIIFFVVLVIYLVAGVLFMKYKRGATGKEVIPNVEFWSSLPGLIKDGCVFFGKKMKELCDRCCKREGYSEI